MPKENKTYTWEDALASMEQQVEALGTLLEYVDSCDPVNPEEFIERMQAQADVVRELFEIPK